MVNAIDIIDKELKKRGHEVFIVAPDPGKEYHIEGVIYLPTIGFKKYNEYYVPIYPSNCVFKLKELNVDVINAHGFAFNAMRSVFWGNVLKIPVVLAFHTTVWAFMDEYSPLDNDISLGITWIYYRNLLKRTSAVIAQTQSSANDLIESGVQADIRIIPTGIDTERFVPGLDGSYIRKRYGLGGYRVVVHVGRLSFEKCIDVLIKAAKYLDNDTKLLLIGRGPLEADLKKQAEDMGVSDKVIFAGFVSDEDLPYCYAAGDIAVSTGIYETQCLTIMEAMASGLPVVTPNARAFVDFIVDGENGMMYEPGAENCAEAMKNCLLTGRKFSENARKTAEAHSIKSSIDSYIALYEEVIENNNAEKATKHKIKNKPKKDKPKTDKPRTKINTLLKKKDPGEKKKIRIPGMKKDPGEKKKIRIPGMKKKE